MRNFGAFLGAHKELVFYVCAAVALNWNFFTLWNSTLICDEGDHLLKIEAARAGDFSTVPYLAMLPVYHGLMGVMIGLINATTLAQVRLVTFLGSLCTIGAFYLLAKRLWPGETLLRTAQFIFLPILFPFLPLIYTDVWALGFALLTVERALANRPTFSAAAAFVAITLRTPNIAWALLAWLLLYSIETKPIHFNKVRLMHWLGRTWAFVALFSSFAVFVYLNHGAAIGDRQNQPLTIDLSTVWFFLLLFFFMFAPTCIAQVRILCYLDTRRIWTLLLVGVITVVLYFHTYAIRHPYNQPGLWFYLRNRLLYWTTAYQSVKCLALIPVLLALLAFISRDLARPQLRWLIPCAAISIIFTPIIEQRYYLAGFAMFQAFRSSLPLRWELINLVFYIVLSVWFVHGIADHDFFL